jgi:hypothetical protein
VTSTIFNRLPVVAALVALAFAACSSPDHPGPVGDAGKGSVNTPPVIIEFGGTANGGTSSEAGSRMSASGGSVDPFAGSAGVSSFGGSNRGGAANGSGIGGTTETSPTFATGGSFDSGGTLSNGGSLDSGGPFSNGGTFSNGTFSNGGTF